MSKRNMSTRSSKSSESSEEVATSSAMTSMTTTPRNPNVGTSGGGSAPHVSSQGADPLQGLKGHGLQQGFHSKSIFPKDLPDFDGELANWDKFDSEITYIVLDMTNIDLSLTEKPQIDSKTNKFIFQCISKCVDAKLYNIICRYKDQGFEAYKFLDQTIGGSLAYRQSKVIREQAALVYYENESMLDYTSRFSKLTMDGWKYGMGEQRNDNGTCPILITRSLMNLPKRFTIWADGKRSLWQEKGGAAFPTVEEYVDMLLDQDKIARRSEISHHDRGASNISYPGAGASNVSNISLNRKDNKLSKNQKRKMKLRLKQASVGGNVGGSQLQQNIQNQTTSLNAAAFRQNNNKQGRAPNNKWRQKQNLTTQAATSQGRGGGGTSQVQGYTDVPRPQQNSSSRDNRPPITCKRCLSRKGTHVSDNCPTKKFCSHCNNGSHDTTECGVKPKQ